MESLTLFQSNRQRDLVEALQTSQKDNSIAYGLGSEHKRKPSHGDRLIGKNLAAMIDENEMSVSSSVNAEPRNPSDNSQGLAAIFEQTSKEISSGKRSRED